MIILVVFFPVPLILVPLTIFEFITYIFLHFPLILKVYDHTCSSFFHFNHLFYLSLNNIFLTNWFCFPFLVCNLNYVYPKNLVLLLYYRYHIKTKPLILLKIAFACCLQNSALHFRT